MATLWLGVERAIATIQPSNESPRFLLVNMIPPAFSRETGQDSEPVLAVHPEGQLLVGAAFTFVNESEPSPLYVSTDAGLNWTLNLVLPVGRVANQAYSFSGTGRRLYASILSSGTRATTLAPSVFMTNDPVSTEKMTVISKLSGVGDNPFIEARGFDQDRIYIGFNDFEAPAGRTASVAISTDGGKTFRTLRIEKRTTFGQDGPQIPVVSHKDGTVYAAFHRWRALSGNFASNGLIVKAADVILVRDDKGGSDPNPFTDLVDPDDRLPGIRVVSNISYPFMVSGTAATGQQRLGGSLSIAVDPNDSAKVYLSWAQTDPSNVYTIHVKKSEDRGQHWSDDLLAIPSAINPAVAVADGGVLGLLYQQLLDVGGPQERWETHLQRRTNSSVSWADLTLSAFPTSKGPAKLFDPYLGGKVRLIPLGSSFYGVFSAPNIPDKQYFPQGVRFQRRNDGERLLDSAGRIPVNVSIDPYFFHVPSR